jgi:hypothetical protein
VNGLASAAKVMFAALAEAKAASDCAFAAFDGVFRIVRMRPTSLINIDCQAISTISNLLNFLLPNTP